MIRVILKESVPGQGNKNDIINVADGFARNFLFPKGKAIAATPEAIKKLGEEKEKSLLQKEKTREKNIELKTKIESMEIEIQERAKKEKLFGSLSAKEVAQALEKKGIKIEPKNIQFEKPIKTTGEHKIGIKLDKKTRAALKVKIIEAN